MHYAIGDIHGGFDELMAVLEKIEKEDQEARFILLGDLVDRGEKVLETLHWAMEHVSEDGKFQCVRGNHEEEVLRWYFSWVKWRAMDEKRKRLGIKGNLLVPEPKTYYDFYDVAKENGFLDEEALLPYIEFMYSLPYHKKMKLQCANGEWKNFILVHGWYEFKEAEDSEEQMRSNIWSRTQEMSKIIFQLKKDTVIIHGHTPTISVSAVEKGGGRLTDRPGYILYRRGAVNIDCGCGYIRQLEGDVRLGAYCLETGEEYYSR